MASFGGSWTFIGLFAAIALLWVGLNAFLLMRRGRTFDPYPYILLNLFLSMLAAIQAPIILMSQNRQSEKDRIRAEHDYEVNLKAELEIMLLHEKIDLLREKQWKELGGDAKGTAGAAGDIDREENPVTLIPDFAPHVPKFAVLRNRCARLRRTSSSVRPLPMNAAIESQSDV